jgi:hypothetical protein
VDYNQSPRRAGSLYFGVFTGENESFERFRAKSTKLQQLWDFPALPVAQGPVSK